MKSDKKRGRGEKGRGRGGGEGEEKGIRTLLKKTLHLEPCIVKSYRQRGRGKGPEGTGSEKRHR